MGGLFSCAESKKEREERARPTVAGSLARPKQPRGWWPGTPRGAEEYAPAPLARNKAHFVDSPTVRRAFVPGKL